MAFLFIPRNFLFSRGQAKITNSGHLRRVLAVAWYRMDDGRVTVMLNDMLRRHWSTWADTKSNMLVNSLNFNSRGFPAAFYRRRQQLNLSSVQCIYVNTQISNWHVDGFNFTFCCCFLKSNLIITSVINSVKWSFRWIYSVLSVTLCVSFNQWSIVAVNVLIKEDKR